MNCLCLGDSEVLAWALGLSRGAAGPCVRVCVCAPSPGAPAADPWLSPGCEQRTFQTFPPGWCWKCQGLCCPDLGGSSSPQGWFGWLCVPAVTLLQGPQLCSEGLGCCQCSWRLQGPEHSGRHVVMSLYKVTCVESIAWGCASASDLPFSTPGTCFLGYTMCKAVQRGFSCCFS